VGGCDLESSSEDTPQADRSSPSLDRGAKAEASGDPGDADASKDDGSTAEPTEAEKPGEDTPRAPSEDPAPTPCRIVEAVFERDPKAGGDAPEFSSVETRTIEAAASWKDWAPTKDQAPPPLTPAALERIAPLSDGVYVSESPKVTFALDISDRLAVAVFEDDPAGPMTQYIYQYDCRPAGFEMIPGADEGGFPELRFAAAKVPTHASPGEASIGTKSVRRGKKVKYDESRVLVETPVVGWVTKPVEWKTEQTYDPRTQTYGDTAEFAIPKGRVAYIYSYEGEGYCFTGDGETIFGASGCLEDRLRPPAIDPREPDPLVSSWWLKLSGAGGHWVEVRPEVIKTRRVHVSP